MSKDTNRYPRVVQFVRETPWAILPSKLLDIQEMVALHVAGVNLTPEEIEARVGPGPSRRDAAIVGSTAVIPIYGVITPRADVMTEMSGGTSIDRLQNTLRAAVADESVKSILLDVNSPGGSVAMLNEMASEIRAARRQKPVVAVANTMAASAAYHLASQASQFYVTPSGSVGAIGTIATHDDVSGMLEKEGVKTTVITSSKYKGEMTPYQPLSEEAKAELQRVVDKHGAQFERDVARGRGVTVDKVRSDFGQGRMLLAQDALQAGMVDGVASFDQVLNALEAQNASGQTYTNTSGNPAAHSVTTTLNIDAREVAARLQGVTATAIRPKSTDTVDVPWDGPRMKANLPNGPDNEKAYLAAFAWYDSNADDPNGDGFPDNKGDYKFIHHMVSDSGEVGAANVTACSQGIAVLNGGRTGTTIPTGDRKGVWDHLAQHLRDAGREPPPLKSLEELDAPEEDVDHVTLELAAGSGLSFADTVAAAIEAVTDEVDGVLALTCSLKEFKEGRTSRSKRESLAALSEALREQLDLVEKTQANAADNDNQAAMHRELMRLEQSRFEGAIR